MEARLLAFPEGQNLEAFDPHIPHNTLNIIALGGEQRV
jgi:hypothetical protein